jgi:periplasmic protein CpxP/Spy
MTLRFRAARPAVAGALVCAASIACAVAPWGVAAFAQPYGQSAPYGGQYPRPAQPTGQAYGDDRQSELATLHAALKITAGQEGAWRDFVAASSPDAQQQARERSAQQMLPGLTAPQRVDLSIAAMEADLDSFRARGRALKAFYATLTPAQQRVFDRQTLPTQQALGGLGR